METKICSKCKEEKKLCNFTKDKRRKDGYYVYCKGCRKIIYNENSEIRREKSKKYYDKIKDEKREIILERNRLWRKNNPNYTTERKKHDPTFKLIKNVRRRLKRFLDINYTTKRSQTISLLGCSPQFLKEYIEKQFSDGMTWELVGQYIHIDHIIPLSSAKTEEELYKLCHYSNLQPLWAEENLKKSNKILI